MSSFHPPRRWGPWLTLILLAACNGCGEADIDQGTVDPPIRYAKQDRNSESSDQGANRVENGGSPAPKAQEKKYAGISFTIPEDWQELELTPEQRFAIESKFVIPNENGEMELTMTSMGGGIAGNVDRWIGQFQIAPGERPKTDTVDIGSVQARWLDVRGTYTARVSQNPGPHRDWRLLGVGIPVNPKDFFLKLTGPRAAVADFHDEFLKFVKAARFSD